MADQSPQSRPPQRPVQNSEVYLLRQALPFSAIPPLSPPSPITPGEDEDECADALRPPAMAACCDEKLTAEDRLSRAVHVLSTEAAALQNLAQLYSADRLARDGFNRAVDTIVRRQRQGGKVVAMGVGKSGHIAKKLVATFNSFALQAVFLHPTEALHGDLGLVGRADTLLVLTFSGKTPELLTLLPHLDSSLPLILLTGHARPETCELARHRRRRPRRRDDGDTILLPAPVHEPETVSFGLAAPTTSTTAALALADALALVAASELHARHHYPTSLASVFARNHPGGAIGAALLQQQQQQPQHHHHHQQQQHQHHSSSPDTSDVRSLVAARPDELAELRGDPARLTGADVLRARYASRSGWVRLCLRDGDGDGDGDGVAAAAAAVAEAEAEAEVEAWAVVPPRRIRRLGRDDLGASVRELARRRALATPPDRFIPVAAGTSVRRAAEWLRGLRAATAGAATCGVAGVGVGEAEAEGEREGEGEGEADEEEEGPYGDDAVVAVMENGECVGLLEVGTLLEAA